MNIGELRDRANSRLQSEAFSGVNRASMTYSERYIIDRIYDLEDKVEILIKALEQKQVS